MGAPRRLRHRLTPARMAVPQTSARVESGPAAAAVSGPERAAPRVSGPARLGPRTKRLVERLSPGDIAILDHPAIDRLSAEELVASGVGCVVNVSPSSSVRYPNRGPSILAAAGVHLVDMPGAPLFAELEEGDPIVVEGGRLTQGGRRVAEGRVLDRETVAREAAAARREVVVTLESFVGNTLTHLRAERGLFGDGLDLPPLDTDFRDRPALIVVRGTGHARDLPALAGFISEQKAALVGVDGGADALLATGLIPDVIVGDMDSASDRALASGAELLVHAYRDGRAPGRARVDALGLPCKLVAAPGTSEDAALLIAAEKGARPVVTVGSPVGLVECLERGREGMASTLLARLVLGDLLVDARGISRLFPR